MRCELLLQRSCLISFVLKSSYWSTSSSPSGINIILSSHSEAICTISLLLMLQSWTLEMSSIIKFYILKNKLIKQKYFLITSCVTYGDFTDLLHSLFFSVVLSQYQQRYVVWLQFWPLRMYLTIFVLPTCEIWLRHNHHLLFENDHVHVQLCTISNLWMKYTYPFVSNCSLEEQHEHC